MAKSTDSTSSAVVPFLFEGDGLVRVIKRQGEPWFVAGDVARLLGYRDAEKALRIVEIDEKGTLQKGTFGLNQDLSVVSESGLYLLIFRSRKPKAITFRKWVTGEVLPTIRKTGGYRMRAPAPAGATAEQIEGRLQVDKMHAATRALEVLRRSAGSRTAALAAPGLYASFGISINLDASDTLAQGELPLREFAEDTVH